MFIQNIIGEMVDMLSEYEKEERHIFVCKECSFVSNSFDKSKQHSIDSKHTVTEYLKVDNDYNNISDLVKLKSFYYGGCEKGNNNYSKRKHGVEGRYGKNG